MTNEGRNGTPENAMLEIDREFEVLNKTKKNPKKWIIKRGIHRKSKKRLVI